MTQAQEVRRGYEQFVPPPAPPGMYVRPRVRAFPAAGRTACEPRPGGRRLVPRAPAVQRHPRDRLYHLEPVRVGTRTIASAADTQPAVLAAGTSPGGRAETDGAAPGHRVLPERPAAIWILYLAERPVPAVSRRLLRRHGDPSRPGRSSRSYPPPPARTRVRHSRSRRQKFRRCHPACHLAPVAAQLARQGPSPSRDRRYQTTGGLGIGPLNGHDRSACRHGRIKWSAK